MTDMNFENSDFSSIWMRTEDEDNNSDDAQFFDLKDPQQFLQSRFGKDAVLEFKGMIACSEKLASILGEVKQSMGTRSTQTGWAR